MHLLFFFYLVQTRPEVGWCESDLTLITAYAPEWICVHCSSLIKGISKLNPPPPPLCCVHTEAACCSIAPPGGHSLLCCYISISLPISFQFERLGSFLFVSYDLVADPLRLSPLFFSESKLSVSVLFPFPFPASLHLYDVVPCLCRAPLPVHCYLHLPSLTLITIPFGIPLSMFSFLPLSFLCLSLPPSSGLKYVNRPHQGRFQTILTFNCLGLNISLSLCLCVCRSSLLFSLHAAAVTAAMLWSNTRDWSGV